MKKALIGCLGFVVILILAGVAAVALMDGHYQVERSQEIAAKPEAVYAVVADLHTWPDWTVWSREADPDATWDFNDQVGDGASMSWTGPVHGEGKLALKNCVAGKGIEYDMSFIEGGESMDSVGRMELTPSAGGTMVRWSMSGELSGVRKLLKPLMDAMIGEMFEGGFEDLSKRFDG